MSRRVVSLVVLGLVAVVVALYVASHLLSPSRAETSLAWEQLRNAIYPSELTRSKMATLVDGLYEEEIVPGAASKISIKLADLVGFGEIDGGDSIDAAVVLIGTSGGSGTFIYLNAVLNHEGEASPAAAVLLGDRVAVRSLTVEDKSIIVGMRVRGVNDPLTQLTTEVTRVYTLENGQLTQGSESLRQVPSDPPNQFAFQPERLTLEPNKSTKRDGTLAPGELATYLVAGAAGEELRVAVSSQFNNAVLSIQGIADTAQLVSRTSYATTWSGVLPSSQDYAITVVNLAGNNLKFSAAIEVRKAAPSRPTPTATARPQATPPKPPSIGGIPAPIKGQIRPDGQALTTLVPDSLTYVSTRAPTVGAAVLDPTSNVLYSQNGDAQLELASVVKMLIALAVMNTAQQENRYVDRFELSLLWPMITLSDNDSATELWDELGGGRGLRNYLASVGVTGITPYDGPFWGTSTASANALALVLGRAAFGDLLNGAHRDLFLQLLQGVTPGQRWGISAGAEGETGSGDIVGLKDGWFPAEAGWRVNSVGFVVSRSSTRYYAIAILTNSQPSWDHGIDTIETLAERVHSILLPKSTSR